MAAASPPVLEQHRRPLRRQAYQGTGGLRGDARRRRPPAPADRRVLEIGCGTGSTAIRLAPIRGSGLRLISLPKCCASPGRNPPQTICASSAPTRKAHSKRPVRRDLRIPGAASGGRSSRRARPRSRKFKARRPADEKTWCFADMDCSCARYSRPPYVRPLPVRQRADEDRAAPRNRRRRLRDRGRAGLRQKPARPLFVAKRPAMRQEESRASGDNLLAEGEVIGDARAEAQQGGRRHVRWRAEPFQKIDFGACRAIQRDLRLGDWLGRRRRAWTSRPVAAWPAPAMRHYALARRQRARQLQPARSRGTRRLAPGVF